MPKPKNRVLLTVTGTLARMLPAKGRPGCLLEMTDDNSTGLYYVPLSPHDCRREFPEGKKITFRIDQDAVRSQDGSYPTAGTADRLWDVVGS